MKSRRLHRLFFAVTLLLTASACESQEKTAGSANVVTDGNSRLANTSDWSQFRGPGGSGVTSDEITFPAEWSDEDIRWKTELPGAGTSSPIVFGNRIYLTCYSGFGIPGESGGTPEQLRLKVVCMDRSSGETLWVREMQPELPEQESIRDEHGYASATPAADAEGLYVFFGKSGVIAFTHDGAERWRADVGSGLSGWGTAASVVLYGNLVIINASVESESIVALDRSTGNEIWRTSGIREAWNTPLLLQNPTGQSELIVPIIGRVLSLDPHTGKQLWSCDTGIQWYMVPSAVAEDGVLYCIGGRSGDGLAIRTGGSGDVTGTHLVWHINKGSNVSSPVLHEGHLYWIHDQRGIAYCVSADTGETVYESRLPRIGQVYASPILVNDRIFTVSRDGTVVVLDARPEFRLLGTTKLEERGLFHASMAFTGDSLLLRSNRFLYCIRAE